MKTSDDSLVNEKTREAIFDKALTKRAAGKPRIQSAMSNEFNDVATSYVQTGTEWLTFIGCPILYDGGLFVTRWEPSEHKVVDSL